MVQSVPLKCLYLTTSSSYYPLRQNKNQNIFLESKTLEVIHFTKHCNDIIDGSIAKCPNLKEVLHHKISTFSNYAKLKTLQLIGIFFKLFYLLKFFKFVILFFILFYS